MAKPQMPDGLWAEVAPLLPPEPGGGSGMTCWRRLRAWQAAGVWEALYRKLRDKLEQAARIDWSRAAADPASMPTRRGGRQIGPNPTDHGKPSTSTTS